MDTPKDMQEDPQHLQRTIIEALQVSPAFDVHEEIEKRIHFLAQQLRSTGLRFLVLGISGGVDSSVAGRLSQLACERVRAAGEPAEFIAVRLPYGTQADEADAQRALAFIRADRTMTVNIQAAADALLKSLTDGGLLFADETQRDFVLGNIKARQRMVAQYALAGTHAGLVVGTDHAAEALMGFFTKFGDGACDVAPLTGLNKRRVRALASALGADEVLAMKTPTADLESLQPQRPDEDAFGVSYAEIDDFLEGKRVSEAVYQIIFKFYQGTMHKRQLPITP